MFRYLLPCLAAVLAHAADAPAGDANRGKQVYQVRCIACHSVDYNGTGPAHKGVYGRRAGLAAGFDYSSALKQSGITWNDNTLNQWLTNPEALVPGQKMGVSVPDAQERSDLIAYLRTLKP